ncbi:lipoate-protein ligase [Halanaerobium congolense]|jgi:lipoate-protein ligase A|uniref:lipoate--protein ligase n=1 Tax=Halanaerobium congolense TaxID=54121 RepID=A0A1G8SD60_9FIRM|nr:lipoate--protein ligase [Halanaerobium congolense]TDS24844.1 lipoate-protein ligase [Halanaerobium congolense]SDJ27137.1 lipoate-protein ligase [Halanaerobium congolense]SET81282.1 lipoate-protein ligase [Halanaerobium congolense]
MKNKELKAKFVTGTGYDPWFNLALEEYLLHYLKKNEIILYLWQNDNTVVIGRNQNAWQECRIGDLEAKKGKLARRLSGGGAVFHDLGNLNYTILMPRQRYNLKEQLKVILTALQNLGFEAEFSGRNDILCQGKKISGTAYYFGEKTAYIHGTVLVDSDLAKLVSYLKVSDAKIKSKGIDSVKARVMNLSQIEPQITIKAVKESIKNSFAEIYSQSQLLAETKINNISDKSLKKLYAKYSSWEWRFGKSPDFDISINHHFDWGGIELKLKLSSGIIEEAVIYSDAMYADLIEKLSKSLLNKVFELPVIIESLEKIMINYSWPQVKAQTRELIIKEFIAWLRKELKN